MKLTAERKKRWADHIQQMIDDKKHFVQRNDTWEILKSGVITVEMAPSGGNVMYIEPYI